MKDYKPMGDRVLIEVTQTEATPSGIIMPDSSNESIKTGKVVAFGDGLYSGAGVRIPMQVQIGETVMFQLGMGAQKIRLESTDYYLCREPELLLSVR